MFKHLQRLTSLILQILDLFLISFAVWLTLEILARYFPTSHHELSSSPDNVFLLPITLFAYFCSFIFFNYYKSLRSQTYIKAVSTTLICVLGSSAGLIFILFSLNFQMINRSTLLILSLFCLSFLALSRCLAFFIIGHIRKKGYDINNVLIVGSKFRALEIIDAILAHPEFGYQIVGCLEDNCHEVGQTVAKDIKIVGCLYTDFNKIMTEKNIDELIFAMPLSEIENGSEYISFAEEIGVNIRVLPDWQLHKMTYHPETATVYYDQFIGLPTIALTSIPQKETELFLKTALDYLLTLASLVIFSPIMLLTVIAIKLTSPGPILFKQVRCGLNGRKFTVYKFRTMCADAEDQKDKLFMRNEQDGPAFKIREDPRITRLGKFLRKSSIDELPQLFNILKGDMSMVGPRPPLPSEVAQYKPWHRRRLSMKPGLTCIWQTTARNQTNFDTWMKLDLQYINTWSFLLDLKILLMTIPAVLRMTGW